MPGPSNSKRNREPLIPKRDDKKQETEKIKKTSEDPFDPVEHAQFSKWIRANENILCKEKP